LNARVFEVEAARFQRINDLVKRRKLKVKMIGGQPFVSRREALNYEPEAGGRPAKKKV
jgi:hypothetical protein